MKWKKSSCVQSTHTLLLILCCFDSRPIALLPAVLTSLTVAIPTKANSLLPFGKSGGLSPDKKSVFWRSIYAWFWGVKGTAGMYITDFFSKRQLQALQGIEQGVGEMMLTCRISRPGMFFFDGMNGITMPEYCISRVDLGRWNHALVQSQVWMWFRRKPKSSISSFGIRNYSRKIWSRDVYIILMHRWGIEVLWCFRTYRTSSYWHRIHLSSWKTLLGWRTASEWCMHSRAERQGKNEWCLRLERSHWIESSVSKIRCSSITWCQ